MQLFKQQTISGLCLWKTFISLYSVLWRSTGICLGPRLSILFVDDLCNVINRTRCLTFADDIKIFRAIESPNEYIQLETDIDSVQGWCTASFMNFNTRKTRVISFSRKTSTLIYHYKLCQVPTLLKSWGYLLTKLDSTTIMTTCFLPLTQIDQSSSTL